MLQHKMVLQQTGHASRMAKTLGAIKGFKVVADEDLRRHGMTYLSNMPSCSNKKNESLQHVLSVYRQCFTSSNWNSHRQKRLAKRIMKSCLP